MVLALDPSVKAVKASKALLVEIDHLPAKDLRAMSSAPTVVIPRKNVREKTATVSSVRLDTSAL